MAEPLRSILVFGATGRQGGAVARALLAAGFEVHALTRRPRSAPARALAAAGARLIPGNLDDPRALSAALDGVDAVFATHTPYEKGVEHEEAQGRLAAKLARVAGVKHLVYSSVAAADQATGVAHFESKGRIEASIRSLRFKSWTVLRPTFFMEMFLGERFGRFLRTGLIELALPPATRIQMVSVDDIAQFAVLAFTQPELMTRKVIELAADAPDMDQLAATLGGALGRPLAYTERPEGDLPSDVMPTLRTQRWLRSQGWKVEIAALEQEFPVRLTTLADWAALHLAQLKGLGHG